MSNLGQHTAEALRQREAELGSQTEALTHYKQVAASHELRLLQLEQEVNELCQRHGEAGRYPLKFEPDTKLTQAEPPGDGARPLPQTVEKLSAELRESEAFSRSIIKSSPDCIKVLDLAGNLLSMQSGQELLGIEDIQPFLNKSWIDFWEDADDKRAAQAAVASAAAGRAGAFVGFFRTLRGEPKW